MESPRRPSAPAYNERALFESRIALDLRVDHCGRYECVPSWSIPPTRTLSGRVGFYYVEKSACEAIVNSRPWALREGDLMVVRGGDLLEMEHDPKRPHTSLSLMLAVGQQGMGNVLLERRFARRYRIRDRKGLVTAFEAVFSALEAPFTTRDWAISCAVLQCVVRLIEETRAPLGARQEMDESAVDKVLVAQNWVLPRMNSRVTLGEWARVVKLHPVYFERIFKRATGLSPKAWLRERRLDTARQYLLGTGRSVGEISDILGFKNQFYFSRVFRKQFKKSPSQFRRSGMTF